jgi:hypothetical protein
LWSGGFEPTPDGLLCFFWPNYPLRLEIDLAPDNVNYRLLGYRPTKLLQPAPNVVKAASVAHVVDQDTDMGSAVVDRRHGSKSLLTGGIPYLEFDPDSTVDQFPSMQ